MQPNAKLILQPTSSLLPTSPVFPADVQIPEYKLCYINVTLTLQALFFRRLRPLVFKDKIGSVSLVLPATGEWVSINGLSPVGRRLVTPNGSLSAEHHKRLSNGVSICIDHWRFWARLTSSGAGVRNSFQMAFAHPVLLRFVFSKTVQQSPRLSDMAGH